MVNADVKAASINRRTDALKAVLLKALLDLCIFSMQCSTSEGAKFSHSYDLQRQPVPTTEKIHKRARGELMKESYPTIPIS